MSISPMTSKRIASRILFTGQIVVVCLTGMGCETLINSTFDSAGDAVVKAAGGHSETQDEYYDRIWRESDEAWRRQGGY